MDLKTKIQEDMKTAMRNQDKQRLGAIRLVIAAIKQREIDERITLNDVDVVAILTKLRKQRQDSLAQYESAGRTDLAAQEAFEITLIDEYLPEQLSESEIDKLVAAAFLELGVSTQNEMGKIMAHLKPKLEGRADMALVSKRVKAHFA